MTSETSNGAELAALRRQVAELEARVARQADELAEHEALYNNAACGYHSLNKDGVIIRINDTELRWLGYTREEVVGRMPISELLSRRCILKFRREYAQFLERGWVRDLEFEYVRRDGSTFPILLNSIAVRDDAGAYLMSRSLTVDISQRKLDEQAAELQALFAAIPDAVMHVSREGVLLHLQRSPETAVLLEFADVGRKLHDALPRALSRPLLAALAETAASGEARAVEVEVAGQTIEARVTARGDDALIILRDLSERILAEQASRQAAQQQEVILAQEAALAELSAPLLQIDDRVIAVPLIGAVDPARAQAILEAVLAGVAAHQAAVAILDITGVTSVDAALAAGLVRIGQAARLLGAQLIVTGVQPAVARAFVELGVGLSAIVTRRTLQAGIAHARALVGA
ncbi:MAG: PAS domain S-box protein [Myxococcales bacterium]|nr:PAS domain S-box protein [Myxococcales bacterium]